MYNVVNIANSAGLHIWKLLWAYILQVLTTREKVYNSVVIEVN